MYSVIDLNSILNVSNKSDVIIKIITRVNYTIIIFT